MLITNFGNGEFDSYLNFLEQCLQGGVSSVQMRETGMDINRQVEFGIKLQNLLGHYNVPMIVHDSLQLAKILDCEGLHLGQSDCCAKEARKVLGPNKIIGVSVNSMMQLSHANELDINYVAIGCLYPSSIKRNIERIWTKREFQVACKFSKHKVIGVGGIALENCAQAIEAGADGVAVITSVHNSVNPQKYCQKLISVVNGKKSQEKPRAFHMRIGNKFFN